MSIRSLFNKTALIERSTPSRAATGEVSHSWATVADDGPCTLREIRGASSIEGAGVAMEADFMAFFAWGTDVKTDSEGGAPDRVTIDEVAYTVVYVAGAPQRDAYVAAYLKRRA